VNCGATLPDDDPDSCKSKNVRPEDLEVKVRYTIFGIFHNDATIKLNKGTHIVGAWATFEQSGDMGCVFLQIVIRMRVHQSDELREKYPPAVSGDDDVSKKYDNCFKLPNPDGFETEPQRPEFSDYISEACSLGCGDAGDGKPACITQRALTLGEEYREFYMPVFALGIQCLEETFYRVFDPNLPEGPFARMRDVFRPIVFALMMLAVILAGIKYAGVFSDDVTRLQIPRHEFMWLCLRLLLVGVFATTPAIAFFFDAARASQGSLAALVLDMNEGMLALSDIDMEGNINKIQKIVEDDSDEEDGEFDPAEYTYEYCMFRAPEFNYDGLLYKDINGADIPDSALLARYWDILDCKFAQYFGVGRYDVTKRSASLTLAGAEAETTQLGKARVPANILYGVYLFIVPGIGWVIAILAVVYTVFLFTLFLRFFLVYIAAVMGVSLFFLFSPILIVSILFETTKYVFQKWVSTVLALIMQPLILFVFLVFFIIFLDKVYFGDNHQFIGFNNADNRCAAIGEYNGTKDPNKILMREEGEQCLCDDSTSLACIFGSKTNIEKIKLTLGPLETTLYGMKMSDLNFVYILTAYGKLFVLFFISFFVFQYVETLSQTLTEAGGASATKLAGANMVQNPMETGIKTAKTAIEVGVTMGAGAAARAGGTAARGGGKLMEAMSKKGGDAAGKAAKALKGIGEKAGTGGKGGGKSSLEKAMDVGKKLTDGGGGKNKKKNNDDGNSEGGE
jgi:type IV secretory pathway VirB6-like protein